MHAYAWRLITAGTCYMQGTGLPPLAKVRNPCSERTDVIVLGAGMVGVSTALHLQQRGRAVVLVDRRGAGEETSYGNTGIIQREGVVPYPFPRDIGLMAQYASQPLPEANLHWSALPRSRLGCSATGAPPRRRGGADRTRRAPLIERCIVEHEALMAEAGSLGLDPPHRLPARLSTAQALEAAFAKDEAPIENLWRQLRAARCGQAGRAGAAPEGCRSPAAC